jgi:hypothetical protein
MSSNAYRNHAAECLKRAFKATDPQTRAFLRRMAVSWSDLADQTEKNGGANSGELGCSGMKNLTETADDVDSVALFDSDRTGPRSSRYDSGRIQRRGPFEFHRHR